MNGEKKRRQTPVLFLVMAVLAVIFIDLTGFLNYRTVAVQLEEDRIRRGEGHAVTRMETAISFGKDFRNYYGVDGVFETFSLEFPGPQPFIIDREGQLLYCGESGGKDPARVRAYLSSALFEREFPNVRSEDGGAIAERGLHAVLSPIRQEGETVGFFACLFTEEILRDSFARLAKRVAVLTAVAVPVLAVLMILALRVFRRIREKQGLPAVESQIRLVGLAMLAVGILAVSAVSLYFYQDDYLGRLRNSVHTELENLGRQMERVWQQGVDLRDVPDMKDYLREQIEPLDSVSAVRLVDRLCEARRTEEGSELIGYAFGTGADGKEQLVLEAELSAREMRLELRGVMLALGSSMVILLLFLFEFNVLPELLAERRRGGKTRAALPERQISRTLRFTSFLYATAEYMCAPYAAMMIRARGESLFGLSVGMTAALPLTVEGLTQMLSMAFLPKLIRKWNIRPVLVASALLMIGCNTAAFFTEQALAVVLYRAMAGVAYSGFKLAANELIVGGYKTEAGRSRNIAQSNAGVLSGSLCGAGLGAVISGSLGYESSFLFSAGLFLVYLLFTLWLVPWGALASGKQEGGEKPIGLRSILRALRSPEILAFVLIIAAPLNIGAMLCMTLIPAVCQTRGISSALLSCCYIANGAAGVFLGPALVSVARKRLGLGASVALAFGLTGAALFLLELPPVIVMLIAASLILGFLDGFATPMVTVLFMNLKAVREDLDESTALIFFTEICYVLLTAAPVIAEQLLLPGAMPVGAAAYVAAAALALVFGLRRRGKA